MLAGDIILASFIILVVIRRSVLRVCGPLFTSVCPGKTASFEEMSQLWRAIGNTVLDLTGPRFESQTSCSRDERVTARSKDLRLIITTQYITHS